MNLDSTRIWLAVSAVIVLGVAVSPLDGYAEDTQSIDGNQDIAELVEEESAGKTRSRNASLMIDGATVYEIQEASDELYEDEEYDEEEYSEEDEDDEIYSDDQDDLELEEDEDDETYSDDE